MPHWNELQPSPTFYQDSITTSYYQAYPFIHHRACKVKTWSSQPLWFLHQSLRVLLSTQSQSLKKLMGMKEVLSWSAKPRSKMEKIGDEAYFGGIGNGEDDLRSARSCVE
ncbi:hypothetical protein LINGRAHAP2_LOCUS20381, partial [Linum grandiflorum]